MFQPRAKLEFVRRYCPPRDGWSVFVDIDPSEEGRTGGKCSTPEGRQRRLHMQEDAGDARRELQRLGATVGGSRVDWHRKHDLPRINGDRDIIAFNAKRRFYLVAEVEGESSGQPEQKLYKAIGQIVMAAGEHVFEGWERSLVLVVYGEVMRDHLARAHHLGKMGVSAIALGDTMKHDTLSFGPPLPGMINNRWQEQVRNTSSKAVAEGSEA